MPFGVVTVLTVFLACFLPGCAGSGASDDGSGAPPATFELFSSLGARVGSRAAMVLDSLAATTASLRVVPAESGWFLRSGIADAMQARGIRLTDSAGTRFTATVLLVGAATEYRAPRRESLWGTEVMDRIVRLHGEVRIDEAGLLRSSARFTEEVSDQVPVSSQHRIESNMIPATRGTVPAGGLFSDILEPIVLVGALGVAILLLFTVRS